MDKDTQAKALAAAIRGPMTFGAKVTAGIVFLVLAMTLTLWYHFVIGGWKENECQSTCALQGRGYIFASPMTLAWYGAGANSPQCTCVDRSGIK